MVTQNYRGCDCTGSNTFFIIAKSVNQLCDEIDQFMKEHKTDDNMIYVYDQPVKPSKENLRPEYSVQLDIRDKDNSVRAQMFTSHLRKERIIK